MQQEEEEENQGEGLWCRGPRQGRERYVGGWVRQAGRARLALCRCPRRRLSRVAVCR